MRQQAATSVLSDGPEETRMLKKSHKSELTIDLSNSKVKATSTPSGIDNGDELVWKFKMKKNDVEVPNEGIVDINLVYRRTLSTDPPPSTSGGDELKVDIVEPLTDYPATVTYTVTHNGTSLTWDGPQPSLIIDHIGDPPGGGSGGGGGGGGKPGKPPHGPR